MLKYFITLFCTGFKIFLFAIYWILASHSSNALLRIRGSDASLYTYDLNVKVSSLIALHTNIHSDLYIQRNGNRPNSYIVQLANIKMDDTVDNPFRKSNHEVKNPFILNMNPRDGNVLGIQTTGPEKPYILKVKYRMAKAVTAKIHDLGQLFKEPMTKRKVLDDLPFGKCQTKISMRGTGNTPYIKAEADYTKCNSRSKYNNLAKVYNITKDSKCEVIGYFNKDKIPTRMQVKTQFGMTKLVKVVVNMLLNVRFKGFVPKRRVTQTFPVR